MTTPTPATPTPPPPLSNGGRLGIRALLITAAAVLVLGSFGVLGAAAVGVGSTRVVTDSRALPATMRSLVITTGDIPMAIRITADPTVTEPRADLRMVTSTRAANQQLDVANGAEGTRVTVSGETPAWLEWARGGEITVALPPDLARRLTVTTNLNTGVLMARADLDQLIARTTNGPVILDGSARRIDVNTRNGSITTSKPISVRESFSATTVEGDITAEFKDAAPRTVDAVSRNGDVTVALPARGPYLVRAQSGESTRVRVPETSNPAAAAAQVTARSDDGAVTVEELR